MFAEEDWSEGADGLAPSRVSPGPRGGAEDPRRPVRGAGGGRAEPPRAPQAPAAAERKRHQRLLATLQRLEASAGTRPCPPADGQPARKRPRRRRRAAGCRAEAEGRPAGSAEPGAGREAPGGGGPGPPPGPPSGATGTGGTRAAAGNGTQRAPRRCGAGGRAAAERDRSGAESRRAAVPAPPVPRGVPAEPPADRPAWSSEPEGPGTGASAAGPAQRLTRQQWRNKQKNKRRQKNKLRGGPGEEKEADVEAGTGAGASEPPALEAAPVGRSAALRARMEERLLSARFRYINQQLYTSSSQEAVKLFQNDPEAFQIYHRGFAQQVGRWPENPVDRIIRYLRKRPASLVVADFGCGDCKIASSVRNKVHSFDLVPLSPLVTVCDMAKVPLEAESVDVAVFCLALMGTNLQEILEEANRVLKQGGTLLVAEVASRFEDIRAFMSAMAQLGFKSVSKDLSSPFFFLLEFSKTAPPRPRPCAGLRLRPCRYKRR